MASTDIEVLSTRGVLALCPHWGVHGAPDPLGQHALEQRLRGVLAPFDGQIVGSDGELVLVSLRDSGPATLAALAVGRAFPHGVVGLGLGPVLQGSLGPTGRQVSLARRLAWRELPGQVACTQAFYEASTLPPGIGGYRAPAELQAALGFPSYRLADYRDVPGG